MLNVKVDIRDAFSGQWEAVLLLLTSSFRNTSAVEILVDSQWLSSMLEDALSSLAHDEERRRTTGNMSYDSIPLEP